MWIEHLRLFTPQLESQHGFYTETLGLPELERTETRFTVAVGRSRLEWVHSPEPTHYHFAWGIAPDALEEASGWLAERTPLLRGADPDRPDQTAFRSESWDARMVYFRDPAGHIGELIAHRSRPERTASPFGPSSLLDVCEIGLVSADVLAQVQTLSSRYGLEPFRQDPDPLFTAMGSATGMLIVVQEGRRWFPDLEQVAQPAPLELRLRLEGGETVWLNAALERL